MSICGRTTRSSVRDHGLTPVATDREEGTIDPLVGSCETANIRLSTSRLVNDLGLVESDPGLQEL